MAGLTFLRVVSNDQLDAQEKAAYDSLQERQNAPVIKGIVGYLKRCWDAAYKAKQPIERIMLEALEQRAGKYSAEKLSKIRMQGGSEVYMLVTEVKCRAAESWLRDILLDSGSPPWDLEPSPIPSLPKEVEDRISQELVQRILTQVSTNGVMPTPEQEDQLKEVLLQQTRFRKMQEAQNRADGMKLKIEDQLSEGGWFDSFNAFVTDLCTFPSAVVKGPIVRRKRSLGWKKDEGTGQTVVDVVEKLGPDFERVDPFRIYPEPNCSNVNDGYIFQHHPLNRSALADLIGVPGYDDEAIRHVLTNGCGSNWFLNSGTETQKKDLERKFYFSESPTDMFDVFEFWGKVSGAMLIEWGMSPTDIPDPAKEYDANVWLTGDYAIKAVLNYDPLGEKPYSVTSFIKVPGAFWGKSIPEILKDIQNVCNAAARALVNNMGISSGPQVEVNTDRIAHNENITQMYPWKIWQVNNDPLGANAPAIRFEQPESNAQDLMAVYEKFSRLADDHSGIPAYVYGDLNTQGAGRTASGLSMLMGSAGKAIRQVVMHIDHDLVTSIVRRQFIFNMRYDEDETIKGDCQVVAKGAVNLAVKETVNVRRIEFLNATANPIDTQIMGMDGRAAVLREVAKGLQMPEDEVVPSREKSAAMALLQPQMAVPGALPGGAPAGVPTTPGGAPVGGADTNLVRNSDTGASA